MKIDLPMESVLALADALSTTPVKGRAEMRKHSKLFKELVDKCRVFNNEEKTEFHWIPGIVEWTDDDLIKYLAEILDRRIDAGINGHHSLGYTMLLEAMDKK